MFSDRPWPCSCPCDCGCDENNAVMDNDYCQDCIEGRHEVWPWPSERDIKALEEWLAQMRQQLEIRRGQR